MRAIGEHNIARTSTRRRGQCGRTTDHSKRGTQSPATSNACILTWAMLRCAHGAGWRANERAGGRVDVWAVAARTGLVSTEQIPRSDSSGARAGAGDHVVVESVHRGTSSVSSWECAGSRPPPERVVATMIITQRQAYS
jgi:hypothetical protein